MPLLTTQSAISAPHVETDISASRRQFLKGALAVAGLCLLPSMIPAPARAALVGAPARTLPLHNLHTGEAMRITYWENGAYVPQALAQINHLLRDFRTGERFGMDNALLDLTFALHARLETSAPIEIISGYRSPTTNHMLHSQSGGVAKKSLHMEGKALDIRVPGRSLKTVHQHALIIGLGGVGYYPSSDFVHVDTGRVRQWQGA